MAIYHLETKVVTRGVGRSACAAAAYLSCSKILNDYDGVLHDFTRKKGLVWESIFLPDKAPAEWKNRAILWNAVEESEKAKDSRLAREFIVALPVELNSTEWKTLLTEFIQEQFVKEGMCADVAIHDPDPAGHNPHAHILLTMRPLDKEGRWQHKTEKEYLCVKGSEERAFTATEFKTAQADGWEKQYPYKVGKKKVYMAPSAAEVQGLERVSKHPKSTKYGRQNPTTARWNSEEQLIVRREKWAEVVNRHLAMHTEQKPKIDHRSYAARGLDEQPTIHEGVAARVLEAKGFVSDRCELNRQIKADNALLRELRASVKKLMEAVKNTIPAIAEAMETVRQNIMFFCYQLGHVRTSKEEAAEYVSGAKSKLERYAGLVEKIRENSQERKARVEEKDSTAFWNLPKQKKLSARIAELTELLEELRSEKAVVLDSLQCGDDSGVSAVKKNVAQTEVVLIKLEAQEKKHSAELDAAYKQYTELQRRAAKLDPIKVYDTRQSIRPDKERIVLEKVQETYGDKFNPFTMFESKREASNLLNEKFEDSMAKVMKRERERRILREQQQRKKQGDWER